MANRVYNLRASNITQERLPMQLVDNGDGTFSFAVSAPNTRTAIDRLKVINATILNGASLSDTVDLLGFILVGLHMPSAWTTANITFQGAPDLVGTLQNVYDDYASEYVVFAASSRFIAIPPFKIPGIRNLKIRSGTSSTPVNQGAERIIGVVVREM